MPFTKMKNSCAPIYSDEAKKNLHGSYLYNVLPEYKSLERDQIIDILKSKRLDYSVCMQNFSGEFNISTFLRNSNIFGVKEIFYFGKKKIDLRGAQGTHLYQDITWLDSEDQLLELKTKYNFVGVDILPNSVPINKFDFSIKNNLYLFGSEGEGLLPSVLQMCDSFVHIPQRGSCPSLNVGCASAVVMHYAELALGQAQSSL